MRSLAISLILGSLLAACSNNDLELGDGGVNDRGTAMGRDAAPADASLAFDAMTPADTGPSRDARAPDDAAAHSDTGVSSDTGVRADGGSPSDTGTASDSAAGTDLGARDALPRDVGSADIGFRDAAAFDASPPDTGGSDAGARTCHTSTDCLRTELCFGPQGCGLPWTCVPSMACTHDFAPFCSCRGVTVFGSSSCPPEPYAIRGACPATDAGVADSGSRDAGGGSMGDLCDMHLDCMTGLLCCYPCGIPGCHNRCIPPTPAGICPFFP